jgi:hypothetical protein
MEIEANMDPVLLPQMNNPINLFEHGLMKSVSIVVLNPQRVAGGDTDEIKAPIGDPAEVIFAEIAVRAGGEGL